MAAHQTQQSWLLTSDSTTCTVCPCWRGSGPLLCLGCVTVHTQRSTVAHAHEPVRQGVVHCDDVQQSVANFSAKVNIPW